MYQFYVSPLLNNLLPVYFFYNIFYISFFVEANMWMSTEEMPIFWDCWHVDQITREGTIKRKSLFEEIQSNFGGTLIGLRLPTPEDIVVGSVFTLHITHPYSKDHDWPRVKLREEIVEITPSGIILSRENYRDKVLVTNDYFFGEFLLIEPNCYPFDVFFPLARDNVIRLKF